MKTYTPTDQNTKDLLKNWTRKNGQLWEIFLKYGPDNTITAKTLEQIEQDTNTTVKTKGRVNFQCYPFIEKYNIKETIFHGWESSTFYQNFQLNSEGLIEVRDLPRNTIPYEEFEKFAVEKLDKKIKDFIDSHDDIVLMYSQGIDSILLMAYLHKYNALGKTELVYVNNQEPDYEPIMVDGEIFLPLWNKNPYIETYWKDRLSNPTLEYKNHHENKHNPNKSHVLSEGAILKFDNNLDLSFEKTLGFKKVTELKMNEDTLIKWANNRDPEPFFNYQSYEVAEQFKDRPVIIGHEGNSVLFHKWEWVRRIGKHIPIDENYYTKTVNGIDWDLEWDNDWGIITLFQPKQRGYDNKDIGNEFTPISDFELMSMLPFIDTETIDPLDVANATMIKKMIHQMVGDKFDHLIVKEGNNWMNFWTLARIPVSKLDPENLNLYVNKKSNLHNVSFCKKALQVAKRTGWIFASDLLQMKFTNKVTLLYADNFPTAVVKIN